MDQSAVSIRPRALLGASLAMLLLAAAIAIPSAARAGASASVSCTKATDIEAIIDDSGSMAITDEDRLRVQAMNLLIDSLSPGTSLGAVEFGGSFLASEPAADTLFPPEAVGPNAAAMRTAMKEKVNADSGLTDYNAAFAQSDLDNPGADARIFLTDGGHDAGEYKNGHLVHPVPTYVIGFGPSFVTKGADSARLKEIANSTGGALFALEDSSDLQAVSNSIAAALTCQTPPQTFKDELAKGAAKEHTLTIGAATKALQVVLTWASPKDRFKLSGFKLVQGKRLIALGRRQPRKLKVTVKASSETFTIVQVSGLSRGKLHFKVRAAKIGSGSPKVKVTTQASQRAHR
ncbi:MAG TPA: vWA domain-containing protein [Solirubrobacterales bacterium]|nr:vWA domain-containing protein [Solirubrobacterales bacterium]